MAVVQMRNAFGSADSAVRRIAGPEMFRSLVGRSPGICAVRQFIERAAAKDSNAMLLGETGTGKKAVARRIHYESNRKAGPFITVDGSAVPPSSLEFELAVGGTLFLDEVGDIDLDIQPKLVRLIRSNVRVISTCHRDLHTMIVEGRFRKDLHDLLAIVSITMPTLRERREDIPLLISEISARLEQRGLCSKSVSDRALRAMLAYDWPGNVRELAKLIEHCSDSTTGPSIAIDQLPQRIRGVSAAANDSAGTLVSREAGAREVEQLDLQRIELKGLFQLLETRLIRDALEHSGGVVAGAAKRLGLRRDSFETKMRRYGIAETRAGSAEWRREGKPDETR